MSGNNLLLWMSARGQGSLSQFRSAIERLRVDAEGDLESDDTSLEAGWGFEGSGRLSAYTVLRLDFRCLSFAEFLQQTWKITPTTFAVTKHGNRYLGVLNGGRSPRLLDVLSSDYPNIKITLDDNGKNPDVITVASDRLGYIQEFAKNQGIHVEPDASARLLVSSGHLLGQSTLREDSLPTGPGWQITKFSIRNSTPRWIDVREEDLVMSKRTSLVRYTSQDQVLYFLVRLGRVFPINQQDGKYIALQGRLRSPLFRYDVVRETLHIPGWFRPPLLIDRALILTSGTCPKYDPSNRELAYAMVPPYLASLTATIAGQRLVT